MDAENEIPLPPGGLDPENIANDPDLLFDAAKALNDQIAHELSNDIAKSTENETDGIKKIEQDPALELISKQPVPGITGDDPVRLYLKDIGSIELLDVNHEFWLAARMAAIRRLDIIGRQHPLASQGDSPQTRIFRALFEESVTAWV